MANDDLPLKLQLTRLYNSLREWILADVQQIIGKNIVGGKVVGSQISGTIPSTSVPYSGATPASVAATATVGTATSGANHADHQHAMGIVTSKGDLLTYGTAPQRHAVGSDNSILTADSSKTDGLDYKQTITITGEIQGSDFKPSGLTGATSASRYVGATTSGAPASGTFSLGDFAIDQTGKIYVCTVAGSPGTWTAVGGSGGGTETINVPIRFRNPQVSSNTGNSFWTVDAFTATDMGHWEFVKSVQGNIFGIVAVPHNLAGTPNAKIILSVAANATTGTAVMQVATKPVANGATYNPASLTSETAQNVSMPGTAYFRKDVTFTLTNAPSADDQLIVEVLHNGTSGSETLAVNLFLMAAVLQIDVTT